VPESRSTATPGAGRWKLLAVLLVCMAPVVASYFTYYVLRPSGRTNYAQLVTPLRAIPDDLGLRDLAGRPVTSASLKGQWLLVVVAGGACGGDCEKRLYAQRQLRDMLGRDRDRVDNLWLVSDDATVSPSLVAALGPGATVLRASAPGLHAWLGGSEEAMFVVDPQGQWMMQAPALPDPQRFKRDLERLLRASASWDRAGREVLP
jgi:hypothetical protein